MGSYQDDGSSSTKSTLKMMTTADFIHLCMCIFACAAALGLFGIGTPSSSESTLHVFQVGTELDITSTLLSCILQGLLDEPSAKYSFLPATIPSNYSSVGPYPEGATEKDIEDDFYPFIEHDGRLHIAQKNLDITTVTRTNVDDINSLEYHFRTLFDDVIYVASNHATNDANIHEEYCGYRNVLCIDYNDFGLESNNAEDIDQSVSHVKVALEGKFSFLARKLDVERANTRVKQMMDNMTEKETSGDDWTFGIHLADRVRDDERQQQQHSSSVKLDPSYFKSFDASSSSVLLAPIPETGIATATALLSTWGKENDIEVKTHLDRADIIKPISSKVTDISIFTSQDAWWEYNAIDKIHQAGEEKMVEPVKVTVLREPLEQFISLYDYALNEPRHSNHKKFRDIFGEGTLESHLNQMEIEVEESLYSRLSKASHIIHHQLHSQMKLLAGGHTNSLLNSEQALVEKYQAALTNLESFHVVATQQNLDSSLLPQLQHWLPWADQDGKMIPLVSTHKGSKKSVISDDTAEWLKENVLVYDYMLYERAKEIEQERLQVISKPMPKLQSGTIQVKNVNDFEHLEGNISPGANPAKFELDSYIERFDSSSSSVLFAHIPKTGGSSVESLFKSWGKENGIKIRSNMDRADVIKPKASSNNVADIKVFQSHEAWWGYNAIDKTPKADEEIVEFLKVTVLREPVKQFISLYDYALNEPKHSNQKRFQGIFARSTLEGHLNNFKAEMEKGGFSRLSEASRILYYQLHSQMKFLAGLGRNTQSLNSKQALAEIYEISLTKLESFHVVATQEKLDSSLLPQLKHWLPWADQSTQQLPQLNTHVQRTEKSVLSNDMIEWLNENILVHDNKLYERAKEIERERLQVILDKQRKY